MTPSVSRGASKEGGNRSARARAVVEDPGVLVEEISRVLGDVTRRAEGGGHRSQVGKSNEALTIDGID